MDELKSGREPRKSIHLFDLDDTLMLTEARVLVRDAQGGLLAALSPAQFSAYAAKTGETLDFREFSDLGILSRGIVVKYTKGIIDTILKYGTRSRFGILTARAEKKLHAAFLIRLFRSLFGIRLAKELIFAVSDSRFADYMDRADAASARRFSSLTVSGKKALVIAEELVGRGFNDISFYDDSRENLEGFKVLREAFPHVVYKPHFIDPTWKVRLAEFWESGEPAKRLIKGVHSVRLLLEHHSSFRTDQDPALLTLLEGNPIRLETHPVCLVYAAGKFYLRRADASGPPQP